MEEIEENSLKKLHESVGYLVKEDKLWYVIAQNKNPNEGFVPWASITWIPKGSVLKVTDVS